MIHFALIFAVLSCRPAAADQPDSYELTATFQRSIASPAKHNAAALRFSPDGKLLAEIGGYQDLGVRVWDALSGNKTAEVTLEATGNDARVEFTAEGTRLIAGAKHDVVILDPRNGRIVKRMKVDIAEKYTDMGSKFAVSLDGRWLAVSDAGRVRVFATDSGKEVQTFDAGEKTTFWALAFLPDNDTLVATSYLPKLLYGSVKTGKTHPSQSDPCAKYATVLMVSPDGQSLFTGNGEGQLCVWSAEAGTMDQLLAFAERSNNTPLGVSADSSRLISADNDNNLEIWDVPGRRLLRKVATYYLQGVSPSKDWSVLTASTEKELLVLDPVSGEERAVLPVTAFDLHSLAVSPDAQTVVAGGFTSFLYETATGRRRQFSSGGSYYALAYSPDGSTLAADELGGKIDIYKIGPAPTPTVAAPAGAAKLAATASFSSASGSLKNGEPAKLTLTVSNAGPGPAYAVHLTPRVKPFHPGLLPPPEIVLETLAAGQMARKEISLRTTDRLASGGVTVGIDVTEGNGFDAAPVSVSFEAQGYSPPRLELSDIALPDGPIEKAASVRLQVTVKNFGGAPASGVKAALSNKAANVFVEPAEPVDLGIMAPGAAKTAEFKITLNNRAPAAGVLPIKLAVSEASGAFGFKERSLGLKPGQPAPSIADLVAVQGPELNLKRLGVLSADGLKSAHHVVASPDGRWIAANDDARKIYVWDVQAQSLKTTASGSGNTKFGNYFPAAFSPDGNSVVGIIEDNSYLIDSQKGSQRKLWSGVATRYETKKSENTFMREMTFMYNTLFAGTYSPDGRLVALGGCYENNVEEEAMLVDPANGALKTLPSASACVNDIKFLRDGHTAVFGRRGGAVELWDTQTAARVGVIKVTEKNVNAVAVSPDGNTLAIATEEKGLFLWDLAKSQLLATLDPKEFFLDPEAVEFSPDGRWLAVQNSSKLALYDAAGGEKKSEVSTDYTHPFAFLPGGRIAISQGGSVVLFDMYGGKGAAVAAPKPKAPAKLTAQVAFHEPRRTGVLQGGDTGTLDVTIVNEGQGKAYGVRLLPALLTPAAGLKAPEPVVVGDIEPGKSAKQSLRIGSTARLAAQTIKLKLEIREGNGFDAPPSQIEFQTSEVTAPKLEISGLSVAGGAVKVNEVNRLSIAIRNSGQGTAKDVSAELDLGNADIFPAGETKAALGDLAPGDSKSAEFQFFVNSRFNGKELPVALSLHEALGSFGLTGQPLHLALGQTPSLKLVTIQAVQAGDDLEDVDTPPSVKTPVNPDAYAVVIGIERYRQHGIPAVDYATRDAQIVSDYLTKAMGFDSKNVILLQNEGAAKTDLDKYLGTWLKNRVTPSSRVFIFYAGHGAPNPASGESFLIPYDGDPAYTKETAYPLGDLYATLAQLPTKDVTVAVDACFSGQGKRSIIAAGARPLVSVKAGPPPGENTVVLAATGGSQISTFYPDGQHGLMTFFLLKGLKGAADADHNGKITTAKLFAYMRPEIEREARKQNVEQAPTLSPSVDALGARAQAVWVKLK